MRAEREGYRKRSIIARHSWICIKDNPTLSRMIKHHCTYKSFNKVRSDCSEGAPISLLFEEMSFATFGALENELKVAMIRPPCT